MTEEKARPSNVVPEGNCVRISGMHWVGYSPRADRRRNMAIAVPTCFPLQWNPSSRTWSQHNKQDVFDATLTHVTRENGYFWIEPIEQPSIERWLSASCKAEHADVNQD